MRRPRRRTILAALAVGFAGVIVSTAVVLAPGLVQLAPAAAPAAWLSVDRGGESILLRVELGSEPSVTAVASHRQARGGGGRWIVDPAGGHRAWLAPSAGGHRLEFLADDGAVDWSVEAPGAPPQAALWSSDGRFLAGLTWTDGRGAEDATHAVIVDTMRRTVAVRQIEQGSALLGFADVGDAIILAARRSDDRGQVTSWTFERLDALTAQPEAGTPDMIRTDPRATVLAAVSTSAGAWLGAAAIVRPDGEIVDGERLMVRALGATTGVELGRAPSGYDWALFRPDGRSALVAIRDLADPERIRQSIAVVDLQGRASPVWDGPTSGEPLLAPDGGSMLLVGWEAGPTVDIVDLGAARALSVELPTGVDNVVPLALADGALPPRRQVAWQPPAEPDPTLPPAIAAPDGASVLARRDRTDANGRRSVQFAWLTPTRDGLGVERQSPWIEADGDAQLFALPDPAGDSVVIVIAGEGGVSAVRWRSDRLEPIPLPAGWSPFAGLALRPDGRALATVGADELRILDLATGRQQAVPLPVYEDHGTWYASPVGWTADGGAVVLAPGSHCTDYCGFTYPTLVGVEVATGALWPYEAASRVDARWTGAGSPQVSVHTGRWASIEGPEVSTLVLDHRYEAAEPGTRIAWPQAAGRLDERYFGTAWSADGRRLWVTAVIGERQHVVAVDEPVDRASPSDLGILPDEYFLVGVDARERWAIGRRTGDVTAVVELATGRTLEARGWMMERFATLVAGR